jgi:hypothetical protein
VQIGLFDREDRQKEEALCEALDKVRDRFGEKALRTGSTMNIVNGQAGTRDEVGGDMK